MRCGAGSKGTTWTSMRCGAGFKGAELWALEEWCLRVLNSRLSEVCVVRGLKVLNLGRCEVWYEV